MYTVGLAQLKPFHFNQLLAFFREINKPEYMNNFAPHPFDEKHAKDICEYTGRDLYYAILLNETKIIGYCMLRGWDEGYEIPSLGVCILKQYQGYGFGKTIVNFLESLCRLNGCSRIMLKVKRENAVAKRLYENQSYTFEEYDQQFLIGYKTLNEKG